MAKKKIEKVDVNQKFCFGKELSFVANEAYKKLRTNVLFSFPASDENCKLIGVTSCVTQEGKTNTAAGLAYSMSLVGKKVLLLECDLRRPKIAKGMDISNEKGISDLLVGEVNKINDIVQVFENEESRFSVIPCGSIPPNPSEILDSPRMKKTLDSLAKVYDYVIVDLPPVSVVTDPLVVAQYLDGIIVVVKHEYTNKKLLKTTLAQINSTGTRMLGFVYNGAKLSGSYGKKYGSYYYY